MKQLLSISLFIWCLASCTTPYSVNHWAETQDIKPAPPELFGTWFWSTDSGGLDTSNFIRVTELDSDRVTRSMVPEMFSVDWIVTMPKERKTDTILLNGFLFHVDGMLFAEMIRVYDDAQLADQLSTTDLFVAEKKYIYLVRSITADRIEYSDVDAADLKRAMEDLSLSVYTSDKPTDEQYFFGRTQELKSILSSYLKKQLYSDDPVSVFIRRPAGKK
jgi:hypothetical protein